MKDYLICHTSILPDYYLKVVRIKEELKKNPELNVSEACNREGLSRSTFYKYRDHLFRMEGNLKQEATISLLLSHHSGALSNVLSVLSAYKANIMTISQNAPIDNTAIVDLSVDVSAMVISMSELMTLLANTDGVVKVTLAKLKAIDE
ncbi:MAG: ACT domain-containing protein [Erysipelotrichaceae bacterium]|nr:ACT domain-containing protein [Erysipelotrichaceae bacterium]